MKCQRCSGNGKYKTIFGNTVICDFCYGTGEIAYSEDDRIEPIGNKKPMTNEEWFDTLSTKEKAEWLDKVAENCCQICDEENRELCRRNIAIGCKFENAKKWEMWLKQPHNS